MNARILNVEYIVDEEIGEDSNSDETQDESLVMTRKKKNSFRTHFHAIRVSHCKVNRRKIRNY